MAKPKILKMAQAAFTSAQGKILTAIAKAASKGANNTARANNIAAYLKDKTLKSTPAAEEYLRDIVIPIAKGELSVAAESSESISMTDMPALASLYSLIYQGTSLQSIITAPFTPALFTRYLEFLWVLSNRDDLKPAFITDIPQNINNLVMLMKLPVRSGKSKVAQPFAIALVEQGEVENFKIFVELFEKLWNECHGFPAALQALKTLINDGNPSLLGALNTRGINAELTPYYSRLYTLTVSTDETAVKGRVKRNLISSAEEFASEINRLLSEPKIEIEGFENLDPRHDKWESFLTNQREALGEDKFQQYLQQALGVIPSSAKGDFILFLNRNNFLGEEVPIEVFTDTQQKMAALKGLVANLSTGHDIQGRVQARDVNALMAVDNVREYLQSLAALIESNPEGDDIITAINDLLTTADANTYPQVHQELFNIIIALMQRPVERMNVNIMPLIVAAYSPLKNATSIVGKFTREFLQHLDTVSAEVGKTLVAQYVEMLTFSLHRASEAPVRRYLDTGQCLAILFDDGIKNNAIRVLLGKPEYAEMLMPFLTMLVTRVDLKPDKQFYRYIDNVRNSSLSTTKKDSLISELLVARKEFYLGKGNAADISQSLEDIMLSYMNKAEKTQEVWNLFLRHGLDSSDAKEASLQKFSESLVQYANQIDKDSIFLWITALPLESRAKTLHDLYYYQPKAPAVAAWSGLFFPKAAKSASWANRIKDQYMQTQQTALEPKVDKALRDIKQLSKALGGTWLVMNPQEILVPATLEKFLQTLEMVREAFHTVEKSYPLMSAKQKAFRETQHQEMDQLLSKLQVISNSFKIEIVNQFMKVVRDIADPNNSAMLATKRELISNLLDVYIKNISLDDAGKELSNAVSKVLQAVFESQMTKADKTEWLFMLVQHDLLMPAHEKILSQHLANNIDRAVLEKHMPEWHSLKHATTSKEMLMLMLHSLDAQGSPHVSFIRPSTQPRTDVVDNNTGTTLTPSKGSRSSSH
jgi:hypothetical protein